MSFRCTAKHPLIPILVFISTLAVPDALHAAHPLITEDTGTQGKGNFQLELNSEWDYKKALDVHNTSQAIGGTLSYGWIDSVDFIFSVPYVRGKTADSTDIVAVSGFSDYDADIKWRFHEAGNFSAALKAGVTLPNRNKNAEPGSGNSDYSTYLVASWNDAPWSMNIHVGRVANRDNFGAKSELWHASIGGWRQLGGKTKIVADTGMLSEHDGITSRHLGLFTIGVIYSPAKDVDIDVGLRRGLMRADIDYALLTGLTFRF